VFIYLVEVSKFSVPWLFRLWSSTFWHHVALLADTDVRRNKLPPFWGLNCKSWGIFSVISANYKKDGHWDPGEGLRRRSLVWASGGTALLKGTLSVASQVANGIVKKDLVETVSCPSMGCPFSVFRFPSVMKQEVLGRTNHVFSFYYIVWYDMDTIENTASNSSAVITCVFIAVGLYILSHCLAMLGRGTQAARWSHKPHIFQNKKSWLKRDLIPPTFLVGLDFAALHYLTGMAFLVPCVFNKCTLYCYTFQMSHLWLPILY
jgi:hypothetical protein